ncbi:hypothetical protein ACFLQ2_02535 [archaeon]
MNIVISLVIGLALLVVGYGVAVVLETILKRAFERSKIEEKLKQHGMSGALMGFSLSGIITGLIKWIVFLWFMVSAISVIENAFLVFKEGAASPVLTNFLVSFVNFLPALLQGIVILIVGFLVADYLASAIRTGMKTQANVVAAAVKVIVIYFTVTIALSNPAYGINVGIITEIFNFLVMAVSIGIGGGIAIAMGLGLKDSVSRIAKKHENSTERALLGTIKK